MSRSAVETIIEDLGLGRRFSVTSAIRGKFWVADRSAGITLSEFRKLCAGLELANCCTGAGWAAVVNAEAAKIDRNPRRMMSPIMVTYSRPLR